MIYTFTENHATASESATRMRREFTLRMQADDGADVITTSTAYVYALANKPTPGSGFSFAGLTCDEAFTKKGSITGGIDEAIYVVTINYDVRELEIFTPPALNEVRTSTRSSLVPIRVKQSRNVAATYVRTGFTAIDNNNLININSDGEAEGVDVMFPRSVLSVSKTVALTDITQSYEVQATAIVGRINSAIYRGRAIGTLLCSDVAIQRYSDDKATIEAEFLYEPDLTGAEIGGITGINKKGWQYLSPLTSTEGKSSRIDQIEVHDFYYEADFATALGF